MVWNHRGPCIGCTGRETPHTPDQAASGSRRQLADGRYGLPCWCINRLRRYKAIGFCKRFVAQREICVGIGESFRNIRAGRDSRRNHRPAHGGSERGENEHPSFAKCGPVTVHLKTRAGTYEPLERRQNKHTYVKRICLIIEILHSN